MLRVNLITGDVVPLESCRKVDDRANLVRFLDQAVERIKAIGEDIGARVGHRCEIVGAVIAEVVGLRQSANRFDQTAE